MVAPPVSDLVEIGATVSPKVEAVTTWHQKSPRSSSFIPMLKVVYAT